MKPRGVWWLTPVGALALISAPTLLLADAASPGEYRQQWSTDKYLTTQTVMLVALGMAVFALAGSLPSLRRRRTMTAPWPNLSPAWQHTVDRAVTPLFWLTMGGYAAFGLSAYRNNVSLATLIGALRHQDVSGIATQLGQIKGITSLTQIGMAFVVIAALSLTHRRRRAVVWQVVVVLVLGLIRADLLAERLALIELIVPLGTVYALRAASAGTPRRRMIVRGIPVAVVPLVFVLFGIFEYSRSWVFYRQRTTISYPQFIAERVGGYYATAYNNGQLQLNYMARPGRVPYSTIEAIWTAPGSSLYGGYPTGGRLDPAVQYEQILALHGNPEFNSPGGLVIPFVDWGTVGGLILLAVLGGLLGLAYRYCVDGRGWCVVLFPSLTTGLFELPRYIYWTLGRFTPSLVALVVVCLLARRAERRAREPAPPPEPAAAERVPA